MSYEGQCNGCGMCCTKTVYEDGAAHQYRCTALLLHDEIGKSTATSCGLYDRRYKGMPIVMLRADRQKAYHTVCLPEYPREQDAIPPECSYNWNGLVQIKPKWSLTYAPTLK